MNSKVRKVFTLGVILCMVLALCNGCRKNAGIQFEFGDINDFSTKVLDEHPTVTILIKTKDELEQFCDDSGIIYNGVKYDETFFSHSALLIFFFVNESTMISVNIDNLMVGNDTLTINITRRVPQAGYVDEVEYCSYVFEINQRVVTNINNINVSKIDKNK